MRRTVTSRSPSVLRRWNDPAIEAAVWARCWTPDAVCSLDRFPCADMPTVVFRTSAAEAEIDVSTALSEAAEHLESCACALGALALDIESLIVRFSRVTGANDVEVTLEATCDDAPTPFRVALARSCLLTTYVGATPEWVPHTHVVQAVQMQRRYSGPRFQMPRFGVSIVRGMRSGAGALVYRSPANSPGTPGRLSLQLTEIER
nr:DUF1826 domain-containing protein [Hyphomicrobium nitrativorans]